MIDNFIDIGLSSTFYMKARCKYCLSKPINFYYFMSKRPGFKKIKHISNIKRMCSDQYLNHNPCKFNNISSFNFNPEFKSVNVRRQKNYGSLMFNDYFSCSCGKTTWAFNISSSVIQPEIKERKSKIMLKI